MGAPCPVASVLAPRSRPQQPGKIDSLSWLAAEEGKEGRDEQEGREEKVKMGKKE